MHANLDENLRRTRGRGGFQGCCGVSRSACRRAMSFENDPARPAVIRGESRLRDVRVPHRIASPSPGRVVWRVRQCAVGECPQCDPAPTHQPRAAGPPRGVPWERGDPEHRAAAVRSRRSGACSGPRVQYSLYQVASGQVRGQSESLDDAEPLRCDRGVTLRRGLGWEAVASHLNKGPKNHVESSEAVSSGSVESSSGAKGRRFESCRARQLASELAAPPHASGTPRLAFPSTRAGTNPSCRARQSDRVTYLSGRTSAHVQSQVESPAAHELAHLLHGHCFAGNRGTYRWTAGRAVVIAIPSRSMRRRSTSPCAWQCTTA